MRRLIVVMLLASPAAVAFADDSGASLDKLVGLPWVGTSEQQIAALAGGKLYIQHEVRLGLFAGDEIHGTDEASTTIDGYHFSAKFRLDGKLSRSGNAVSLQFQYLSGDKDNPIGFHWCQSDSGTLTFYKDQGKPGHFLLKGQVETSCGGSMLLELHD